jgi:hypothetical protein
MSSAMSFRAQSATFLGAILMTMAVACAGGGDDATEGGNQAVSAGTSHSAFQCTFSSGLADAGKKYKLTMGDGTATVDSSDLGKHTGKIQKAPKNVPQDSDRFLISGLADDGVTGILIPKNIRTVGHTTVGVEIAPEGGQKGQAFFTCVADDASSAPTSGRGGAGSKSGVKTELKLSCTPGPGADGSFGDAMDITLTPDDKLTVKGSGPDGVEGDGPFDPAFKPKQNTSFVRYLVGGLFDEASTDVLVEKPILAGKGGRIKLEASGETFVTNTFNCTPK